MDPGRHDQRIKNHQKSTQLQEVEEEIQMKGGDTTRNNPNGHKLN